MKIFRERLREAVDEVCRHDGISQEKLAEELGIGRTTFRNYFDRATTMPIDKLVKIADRLDCDINWLCGREVSKEWPKRNPMEEISQKLDRVLNAKDS
ncbi:MAG: helix-turn-helix domain-containing protein [Geminicoccaceae bacterium]